MVLEQPGLMPNQGRMDGGAPKCLPSSRTLGLSLARSDGGPET